MARLASQVQGGYYPTPIRVVEEIANQTELPLRNPEGKIIRWLDPCCGPGIAVDLLRDTLECQAWRQEVYGVELHPQRAAEAGENLTHVMHCDLFDTQISHHAFSGLYLNPPYDYDDKEKRLEHKFLLRCTPYLTPGGLLIFILPQAQLATSARYLARHYRDFDCWSFPDPEYNAFKQIVLMAYRKEDPELSSRNQERLNAWASHRPPEINFQDQTQPYQAPGVDPSPIRFGTFGFNAERSFQDAADNGLWRSLDLRQILETREYAAPAPLLPPRRGHMAMLAAGGFLNNMRLEGPEGPILIKGSSYKVKEVIVKDDESELHRDRLVTAITALNLQSGTLTVIKSNPELDAAADRESEEP